MGTKSAFLKSVGAAAPTAPTLNKAPVSALKSSSQISVLLLQSNWKELAENSVVLWLLLLSPA